MQRSESLQGTHGSWTLQQGGTVETLNCCALARGIAAPHKRGVRDAVSVSWSADGAVWERPHRPQLFGHESRPSAEPGRGELPNGSTLVGRECPGNFRTLHHSCLFLCCGVLLAQARVPTTDGHGRARKSCRVLIGTPHPSPSSSPSVSTLPTSVKSVAVQARR